MIPRPQYVLAAQTPIFEQGPIQGLPLANAVINTAWFDTFQVQDGGIQAPQSGAIFSSGSEIQTGVGTTTTVGAYYLDIYVDHNNASDLPLVIDILGRMAQALDAIVNAPTVRRFVVQPSEPGSNDIRPLMTTVRITSRFFRVVYTYPNANATRFATSLNLRAL